MANRIGYGYQWVRARNGAKEMPAPLRFPVASAYQGAIQGGTNCDVNVGDVVKLLATGYVAIAEGSEKTSYNPGTIDADIPLGVVVAIEPYYDGTVMTPGNKLPGATTYGTNFARQSFVLVVPAEAGIWSVAVDATSASYDTYAEWLAVVGETIDMVNSNGVTLKAEPELDLATIADPVSVSQMWKIQGLTPNLDNKDYDAAGFRLEVIANRYQNAANTAGI
jgi:hypothetical protein